MVEEGIQQHKQNLWKEHLDARWDNRHNTHILWKTIHCLSDRAPPPTLNTSSSITFNNNIATSPKHIANCLTKQFTNTQHTRQTDPITEQGYNMTLTTTKVQEANIIIITIHKVLLNLQSSRAC